MRGARDVNNTCQYGWAADAPCNAWGQPSPFHGCGLTAGHTGACECLCQTGKRYMHGSKHRWRAVDGQAA
jgi:hypothetical protein